MVSFIVSDGSIKCLGLQIQPLNSITGSSEQAKCSPLVYNAVLVPHDSSRNMTDQICLLWEGLENHESVNGINSNAPIHILPLVSKLKSQFSSSFAKEGSGKKKTLPFLTAAWNSMQICISCSG